MRAEHWNAAKTMKYHLEKSALHLVYKDSGLWKECGISQVPKTNHIDRKKRRNELIQGLKQTFGFTAKKVPSCTDIKM
jgi:hypothetical protein